jgi:signal transduction histidine kinase
MNLFKQARIKLTLFYIAILMFVTVFFSTIAYFQNLKTSTFVLEMQKARIERQLEHLGYPRRQSRQTLAILSQEEINLIKGRTFKNLLTLNVLILGVSGILSYFLAGKTLQPIEQMLKKQRVFVSNAAHELKTPLTAIKTNLEVTLRDKKLNLEDAKTAMNETIHDVDKLNSLAVMLLNQESAINEKNFTKVALDELLNNVVEKMEPLATKQNQQINFRSVGAHVYGNAEELEQVFTNLIDNAIKYNKVGGSVNVDMETEKKQFLIKISDQGVGINKSDLPYIFEPFYRADKSRSNSSSFGLGLSIAKEIVEKHGGKIEVASEAEKGSNFTVSLQVV